MLGISLAGTARRGRIATTTRRDGTTALAGHIDQFQLWISRARRCHAGKRAGTARHVDIIGDTKDRPILPRVGKCIRFIGGPIVG